MKKLFGMILILCGILILLVMFLGGGIRNWFANDQSHHHAAQMTGVEDVNIRASSQDIRIIPEERDDLKAVLHGKGAGRYDLDVAPHGDTVKVKLHKGWFNFNLFGLLSRVTLDVHVPADYKQNMDVDYSSGQLDFNGPSKAHPMRLDAFSLNMSSGNANLRNLQINQFKQKASSGSVNASWVATKTAAFKISSGSIDLDHYSGPIDAKLSSGKFTAQLDKLTGAIDVNESSGNISLDLPKEAGFTLDGKVSSGHINCKFPLKNQKIGRNSLQGTHGSGEHKVKLKASSGILDIH